MSTVYLDDLVDCLECGDPLGGWGAGRGLCRRCYLRCYKAGTLEQFPLRPTRASQAAAEAEDDVVPALDLSWHADALCAQTDPEIFFPEKGGSTKEAYSVCADCLVRAECLDYALAVGERFGVWGGLSERKRRRLLGVPDDDVEDAA